MRERTRGIAGYLLIAFGMAWILWEVPVRLGVAVRSPVFQLAMLPGAFAPAVAALVVRKWITREGFADAGLRVNPRKWPYYLVAWLLPLLVVGVVLGLAVTLHISRPDFSLQRGLGFLLPRDARPLPALSPGIRLVIPFQLLITAVVAAPLLWGEEFGWRGYLQRRLLAGRPLLAAVATGLIWGAWHLPLLLRGYGYLDRSALGLVLFPVDTVLLSIIFGWLRERTGSIWSASLAHSATNAVGVSLLMLLFLGGPHWELVSYFGVLGLIPLGGVCAWIVLTGQLKPAAS
jgi:membrane protease YdiL (CAAX protease family)